MNKKDHVLAQDIKRAHAVHQRIAAVLLIALAIAWFIFGVPNIFYNDIEITKTKDCGDQSACYYWMGYTETVTLSHTTENSLGFGGIGPIGYLIWQTFWLIISTLLVALLAGGGILWFFGLLEED